MFDKIVVDLAKCFANEGKSVDFSGHFSADSSLLSYPNATINDVFVDFKLVYNNSNVDVEGTLVVKVSGFCDKCAVEVNKSFCLPFEQTFHKDFSSDPDDYLYFDSKLDMTLAVNDEIVLSLPTLLLCDENCQGLCPKCGANLNSEKCDCDVTRENAFSVLKNLKF